MHISRCDVGDSLHIYSHLPSAMKHRPERNNDGHSQKLDETKYTWSPSSLMSEGRVPHTGPMELLRHTIWTWVCRFLLDPCLSPSRSQENFLRIANLINNFYFYASDISLFVISSQSLRALVGKKKHWFQFPTRENDVILHEDCVHYNVSCGNRSTSPTGRAHSSKFVLSHDTLPVDLPDLWPSDILILAFVVFNPGDLYYLGYNKKFFFK